MISRHPIKPVIAIALTTVVALVAMYSARIFHISITGFFPQSFVTHSLMLVLSIASMWLLSRGQFKRYGLTIGTYKFHPRILLWALPTATVSTARAFAFPIEPGKVGIHELSPFQEILFIWIYASICEELLTRGLLQTLLAEPPYLQASTPGKLSMPVLISGLFFGSMHIVLVTSLGLSAVPGILLLTFFGLVMARYRESTGSLLPAVIIHALFNIGGTLPLWAVQWIRR